jgi:tetratricopeptide (TPR) repeat protein
VSAAPDRDGDGRGGSPAASAWALKQACYDAWQRDPAVARSAAAELGRLALRHPDEDEVQTLAHWTGGIAALTSGHLPDALAQLQAAQAAFEAAGDLLHAAQTQVPQVAVLAMLGRVDAAQVCAERALARFVAAGDEVSAGKVELNLGTLLVRQDRHAEAEPCFRRSAARSARAGHAELSVMADVALANTLAWLGRFEPARQMFERARLRALARGLPLLAAQAQQGIGQIELHRGRWHLALPALVAAVEQTAAAGAPPQRCIEADTTLADAYLAVNLLEEAARLYARVLAQAQALPAPAEEAWAALQRARVRLRQHDAAAAAADLARAHALYEALGNRPMLGLISLAQGGLALQAGHVAAAQTQVAQALTLLDGAAVTAWRLEALVLRAEADAAAGDLAVAAATFDTVLLQSGDLPQLAWRCHAGRGEVARRRGDAGAARAALEQALALIESARAALGDDELRVAMGADADRVQPALVALAEAAGDSAELLQTLERGRARALALTLAAGATGLADRSGLDGPEATSGAGPAPAGPADAAGAASAAEPAPAAAAALEGRTRLQWTRDAWQQALAAGATARAAALQRQVLELEHELLERLRRSRQAGPPAAAGPQPAAAARVDLAALQAALGRDRAMVAFDCRDERLLACVVRSDAVEHRAWPLAALGSLLRSLALQLECACPEVPGAERHRAQRLARLQAVLQALHGAVWAPIAPLLAGRSSVVLLPHRELHGLPFAALHDGTAWLVERCAIQSVPSAAVWLALQQRPPARREGRALIMAVGASQLPQVRLEAGALAQAWPGPVDRREEAEATLAAWTRLAPQAQILHLACHAQFRRDNPAFSHLALADGPLPLFEVAGTPLQAELVSLSACETGIGLATHGDEVLGLARAFLTAGSANVLATLWPVGDAASARLAGDFHRAWQSGLPLAQALQQAQRQAIRAGAHLLDWAGCVLHGRGH